MSGPLLSRDLAHVSAQEREKNNAIRDLQKDVVILKKELTLLKRAMQSITHQQRNQRQVNHQANNNAN